jgi:hypothetical protein
LQQLKLRVANPCGIGFHAKGNKDAWSHLNNELESVRGDLSKKKGAFAPPFFADAGQE